MDRLRRVETLAPRLPPTPAVSEGQSDKRPPLGGRARLCPWPSFAPWGVGGSRSLSSRWPSSLPVGGGQASHLPAGPALTFLCAARPRSISCPDAFAAGAWPVRASKGCPGKTSSQARGFAPGKRAKGRVGVRGFPAVLFSCRKGPRSSPRAHALSGVSGLFGGGVSGTGRGVSLPRPVGDGRFRSRE